MCINVCVSLAFLLPSLRILLNFFGSHKPISLRRFIPQNHTYTDVSTTRSFLISLMMLWNIRFLLPFRISHKSTFQGCQLNLLTLPLFSFCLWGNCICALGFFISYFSLSLLIRVTCMQKAQPFEEEDDMHMYIIILDWYQWRCDLTKCYMHAYQLTHIHGNAELEGEEITQGISMKFNHLNILMHIAAAKRIR